MIEPNEDSPPQLLSQHFSGNIQNIIEYFYSNHGATERVVKKTVSVYSVVLRVLGSRRTSSLNTRCISCLHVGRLVEQKAFHPISGEHQFDFDLLIMFHLHHTQLFHSLAPGYIFLSHSP